MLSLRSVSIAFGGLPLFRGLDLQVEAGQLVGLSGESGCGKTSLLRALLGFVPFSEGTAAICGLPLDAAHISAIRRFVAYVPQELQPPASTGADLIHLTHDLDYNRSLRPSSASVPSPSSSASMSSPSSPAVVPSPSSSASVPSPSSSAVVSSPSSSAVVPSPSGEVLPIPSLLKALGLDAFLLDLEASKLSGGQRQRLLLVAALALPKPLLLLDEPTSALDEDSTQRVAQSLLRACHEERRAALIVSHDPFLLSFCDRVVTLP